MSYTKIYKSKIRQSTISTIKIDWTKGAQNLVGTNASQFLGGWVSKRFVVYHEPSFTWCEQPTTIESVLWCIDGLCQRYANQKYVANWAIDATKIVIVRQLKNRSTRAYRDERNTISQIRKYAKILIFHKTWNVTVLVYRVILIIYRVNIINDNSDDNISFENDKLKFLQSPDSLIENVLNDSIKSKESTKTLPPIHLPKASEFL